MKRIAKRLAVLGVAITLIQTLAYGGVMPTLLTTSPGINVPFDANIQPVNWGNGGGATDAWTIGANGATMTAPTPTTEDLQYRPTLYGSATPVVLPADQPWVVSVDWLADPADPAGLVLKLAAQTNSDDDILVFTGDTVNVGKYVLQVKNNSNLVTYTGLTGGQLTVHYKGNQKLDFYLDGVLQASDFESISDQYTLGWVRLRGGNNTSNNDTFDNLIAGPVVPEPATVMLIAVGALTLSIWQRRHR